MEESKVFVCGDTHGIWDIDKLSIDNWSEQLELTKNDYLIILGDSGINWDTNKESSENIYIRNIHNNKNYTTLFVDGNHLNFENLASDPVVDLLEGKAHKVSESIYHLMRGEVFTINNKKIFTMGGGFSIDKAYRENRVTWWEEEIPTCAEYNYGLETLRKFDNKVDFILTHTCSSSTFKTLDIGLDLSHKRDPSDERSLREYFELLESSIDFKHWFFGHFHDDLEVDEKHTVCYNNKPIRII